MQNPRYALLSGRYAVALCTDVEGLFGEPDPPPRTRYELRGCEPRGELARAVTEAIVEGTAPLGTLDVETPDGPWRFDAVRVLGARGDIVTVESAGAPRRLHGSGATTPCAHFIPVSRETGTGRTEVTFLGCSPRGALRTALDAGAEEFDAVRYQGLTWLGNHHHEADAGRVTGWDTSAGHRGLIDLTVSFPRTGLLPHPTREVWDLFWRDRPTEPGTWRRFPGPGRALWLAQAAALGSYGAREPVPGATYHLDGTGVVDEDAFLCAVGETVHGPGHTFRGGLPEVGEALEGTTLVWHHAGVARACLGVRPLAGRRPATFREITEGLTAAGVRLVLD
ncbi:MULTISPECIES: hypothetical protein [unclassified Streptomyces]|uniref:hypothetical protein n=1 Tax=unclassified Streptomyces TaxID=2593676 RepID=UPI0006F3C15A|nr:MULTISPECIES: hypothetical protein [unclassified Streptomyces]KQX59211.1 hypothetical protein ASD33_02635 [Streptomyces sp. Root1304]KRB00472.1 hypothetical protein ASE09_02635 [Streptomyces sp. Root66D1]